MDTLNIKTPQSHDVRLVAIPSQNVKGNIKDLRFLNDENGEKYEIWKHIEFQKGIVIPEILMLLSVGVFVKDKDIWKGYPKSKSIHFFIVSNYDGKEIAI